ncbi:hypothetical protein CDD83_591 [Cordyceps sp. RAO-2017]|nr:hypothetical protein CDD83_591 [Cordyceps sp. RAO-2017]
MKLRLVALASLLAGAATARLNATKIEVVDMLCYEWSLQDFITLRDGRNYRRRLRRDYPDLNWESDGCTVVPDEPGGFKFGPACERHDFCYRNLKGQRRFYSGVRRSVDRGFDTDLGFTCSTPEAQELSDQACILKCSVYRTVYFAGVKALGGIFGARVDAALPNGTVDGARPLPRRSDVMWDFRRNGSIKEIKDPGRLASRPGPWNEYPERP